MTQVPDSTEAGWYPDPTDAQMLRWWDGQGWTAHISAKLIETVPRATPTAVELRVRVRGAHAARDDDSDAAATSPGGTDAAIDSGASPAASSTGSTPETTASSASPSTVDSGQIRGVAAGALSPAPVGPDAGDSGSGRTGAIDTSAIDTGPVDTGTIDTGTADTGTIGTGTAGTGALDAGAISVDGSTENSSPRAPESRRARRPQLRPRDERAAGRAAFGDLS